MPGKSCLSSGGYMGKYFCSFLIGCCLIASFEVSAQIKDGSYNGTLRCGPLISDAKRGPWTQPVQLHVSGTSISWLRTDGKYTESGSGVFQRGQVNLALKGSWNSSNPINKSWRTAVKLNLEEGKLIGSATISTEDGMQRLRDCNVVIAISLIPGASIANTVPRENTVQTVTQRKNSVATTAIGPLFSTKAEMIEKTHAGQFLDQNKIYVSERAAFAQSVLATLYNDFGVTELPRDVGCMGEFEHNVKTLFGETVRAYVDGSIGGPPDFTFNQQAVKKKLSNVEQTAARLLPENGSGWCSGKSGGHPYLIALPKLRKDFDLAILSAISERRSQLLAQYKQQQAEKLAAKQKQEQEKRAEDQRKAEAERERVARENVAANEKAKYEKGAASRNAKKISELRLPSKFVASNLYVNYLGQWVILMPCSQWLGLLFENNAIESLKAISASGNPGVSIKLNGQPPIGLLFRMESNEAYIYAIVTNNIVEPIQTQGEHSQMALMLQQLTERK